jgi:hypothetical protein
MVAGHTAPLAGDGLLVLGNRECLDWLVHIIS